MLVAVVMPDTSTGVLLVVFVPSPRLPFLLEPQHITLPSIRRVHECCIPRATLVAVVIPDTSTGVALDVLFPFPSSP